MRRCESEAGLEAVANRFHIGIFMGEWRGQERSVASETTHTWDVWYPKAGATGIPFARGRIAPADVILVHAAPQILSVTLRDGTGRVLAEGRDLETTDDTPIARLTRRGERIEREDIWPGTTDIGRLVLLCGGEVGTLKHWWHAEDRSEWRWQIELYNHRYLN